MQNNKTGRYVSKNDDNDFLNPVENLKDISRPSMFAVRVESYFTNEQTPYLLGADINSGNKVKIYLRDDISDKKKIQREGVTIKNFAKKRKLQSDSCVDIGGIILVEGAIKTGDNEWGAGWLSALSKTSSEAEVFEAVVHVTPVKANKSGKLYSLMTIVQEGDWKISEDLKNHLLVDGPMLTKSITDMESVMKDVLADGLTVGVRLSGDNGSISADTVNVYDGRLKANVKPEVAARSFISSRINERVSGLIYSGEVKAELIPLSRVFAGPKTISALQNGKVNQSRLAIFQTEAERQDGTIWSAPVYHRAIVAIRSTDEPDPKTGVRGVFFTHVAPLYPVAVETKNAIKYAQTNVCKPDLPDLSFLTQKNSEHDSADAAHDEPTSFGEDYGDESVNDSVERFMGQNDDAATKSGRAASPTRRRD